MKKILAMLLAVVMVFALVACSNSGTKDDEKTPDAQNTPGTSAPAETDKQPEESTPAEDTPELSGEPIKIGHLTDLTGSEAMTGEEAKRSLEFAVKQLGGGIAGRPVEIVIGDAQGAADTAVDQAKKMVENDGVVAILGPTQAGQKAGVAEYAKEVGVPLIYYNGTPAYLFYGNEWLIGPGGTNPQMTVMADYVYNDLGYDEVEMITMDNIGFKTFSNDFTTAFEAMGGKVLNAQYAPFMGADFTTILSSVNTDADCIMAWTTGSNAIALWTAWYETGLNEKLPMHGLLGSAFTEYYILDQLEAADPAIADAVLGAINPAAYTYDVPGEANEAFVEAWKAEFGTIPQSNLTGQVYQAYEMLKIAIESIDGNTDRTAVRDALLKIDMEGTTGRLSFAGTGAGVKDIHIVQAVRLEDGTYNNKTIKTYKDVGANGLLPAKN